MPDMNDKRASTAPPQLSLATILLWMTCVAAMFRLYGPDFKIVSDDAPQENVFALYALLGLHSVITATQVVAAIAWLYRRQPHHQSPGAWLLCVSFVAFGVGLPFRLSEMLRDWNSKIIYSGADDWGLPIAYPLVYAASAAILYASVARGRMRSDGRWWQSLMWLLCLWNLFALAVFIAFLWQRHPIPLSGGLAVFAFNLDWNWAYLTVSALGVSLAILSDLKNRIPRDGFHWCGAITFGLTIVWTIVYRLVWSL